MSEFSFLKQRLLRCVLFVTLASFLPMTHVNAVPQIKVTVGNELIAGQQQVPAVFRFGGGIWHVPGAFEWIAPRIWEANAKAGTYRLALAWEILAPSKNLNDLKERLRRYPLNDFARQIAQRGGTIVICIDAMPQWLAADPNQRMMADGPAWAKSPPRDYELWSRVVQAIVEHFNGTLALTPYYEIWNEPDWAWRGSMDQFLNLYRASVSGALAADPKVKVGGPAVSDWSAMGTLNEKSRDKTFLQQFFTYASQTPLPQFQRKRLPVDMVSWHAYGRDPAGYHTLVVPAIRRWLQDAGYAANTPLVIDEWNVFPEPPYPEGDLNANHVGAALVGSTLLSMWEAGLDHQAFQLVADPGTPSYTGGVFTTYSAPRASWNSFQLLSKVNGQPLKVQSSDPWLRAAAFREGDTVYLIVSSFVPVESILLKSISERYIVEKPALVAALRRIDQRQLVTFFVKNGGLPGGLSREETDFLISLREEYRSQLNKKANWANGTEISVTLPQAKYQPRAIRYIVDAHHSITPDIVSRSRSALEGKIGGLARQLEQWLRTPEISPQMAMAVSQEIQGKMRIDQALERATPAQAESLKRIHQQTRSEYGKLLQQSIPEGESKPYQEEIVIPAQGGLTLKVEPYSVQLLILKTISDSR